MDRGWLGGVKVAVGEREPGANGKEEEWRDGSQSTDCGGRANMESEREGG